MPPPLKLSVVLIVTLLFAASNFGVLFTSTSVGTVDVPHGDEPTQVHMQRTQPEAKCENATFLKELIAIQKSYSKQYIFLPRENQSHWPTFFKERVKPFQLAKRLSYLNPRSGCRLARWVVRSPSSDNNAVIDCHMRHDKQVLNATSDIKPNDTIYVPLNALERFVQTFLPLLKVDIVLITGQWQTVDVPEWNTTFVPLIDNPHVLHIFVMHKPMYAPISNPKISSWPLGLNFRQLLDFSKEFTRHSAPKTRGIFYSKLGPTADFRTELPSGPRLVPARYYQRLHASRFILAPSGRRPDNYRMYEAIGLGAKPMTNLAPNAFEHFQDLLENIVFGVERWNPSDLACYAKASPTKVNQRVVFDEYWMEYVERKVGIPLTWWDNKEKRVAKLQDIAASMH